MGEGANKGRVSVELRDRTKQFAALIIRLYVKLPKNRDEVIVCGKQLLRSGTSVAAHMREASRARSDAEFVSKLGGALQEADESQLWLELLREECGIQESNTKPIEIECNELIAIITTIIRRVGSKS
ncbi:MAG: four helix bundle protein [Verrucomicrobia bacterium]|jgi:four helix bundle protein|nr:MAG: four helix bundle protein [Verrucomicrobiota bacterium]